MTLTLALALAALGPAADVPAPLKATAASVDLGEVKTGPPSTHTFELKNTGSAALSVRDVVAGCGCTRVELSAKKLEPGDTAKLTVTTNTLTQPEGAAAWTLGVVYRTEVDGKPFDGRLDLKLTAKVVREVSVTPPLMAVSTAGAVTQTLKVEDRRAKPLGVTKVETSSKEITAEVKPAKTDDGRTTQEVVVTVGEGLAVGTHSETVTLRTDDPACPTLEVPVRVHKRAADGVTATPATAAVRFAKDQAEASALVQLRGGGKTVAIKGVECSTPGVAVKFSEDAGPVATVRVIVTAAKAGASGTCEVTVTLTEPTATKIVIPVAWYAP